MSKEITYKLLINAVLFVSGITAAIVPSIIHFEKSLCSPCGPFLEKIGIALITTCFISLLGMWFEHMESAKKERKTEVVPYEAVKHDFSKYLIEKPNYKVSICGISLHSPLNCFIKDGQDNYFTILKNHDLAHIDIHLLFCSPTSSYLKQRAMLEHKDNEHVYYQKYIFEAWCSIAYACQVYFRHKYQDSYVGRLEIKMINNYDLPITHYITNNIAIAGYLTLHLGELSPRLKAYKGSAEYHLASEEFDHLFNSQDCIMLDGNNFMAIEALFSESVGDPELKSVIKNYIDNLKLDSRKQHEKDLADRINVCIANLKEKKYKS